MPTDTVNSGFSAELSYIPLFNLALQQNGMTIAYELKLANDTTDDLEDLK